MPDKNETVEKTVVETPEVTEVDETELLDVISDAVDEVTDPEALAASKPEETAEEIAAREAEEAAAAEVAAATAAEVAAAAEAAMTPEEKAADETAAAKEAEEAAATEAAKTPEEKAADAAAAEAAKTPEEKAADAEEVDPLNDPIPESTKKETADRIKSLIGMSKDATLRGDQGDEILQAITNTGADPEQYTNTLGFLSMYNSTDPEMRRKALAVARGVVNELSIELGEGSADLVAGHEDLVAGIEAGTIDEKSAIEIATSRAKKILDDNRTTAANDKETSAAEVNALIVTGKAQLTTFETSLAADPDYARLRPIFVATLRPALRNTLGSEWGVTAAEIYNAVKAANPAPAVVDGPKPLPKTPLRTKGGGGGGSSTKEGQPESALDAMNAQLADM